MQKTDDSIAVAERINDFVQRNRKTLFFTLGMIVLLFAGLIVFLTLNNHLQKNAIAEVEEFKTKFENINFFTPEEEVNALLEDLKKFAGRNSGYAGGRAWSIAGQIYAEREDWPATEDAWYKAAKAASKTYLAPAAYFNAAAAAENQGKLERAIELLEQSISTKFEFVAAPRAQFSIGRLHEQLGNLDQAVEAYRNVLQNWPAITTWADLAQSQIIAIEINR